MGIKDNFSQAVKELWKKDGQDKKDDKQPSELERYLRNDNGGQGTTVLSEDDYSNGGVPLETPYYRNTDKNANQQPQAPTAEPQNVQQAQNVQQEFTNAPGGDQQQNINADQQPYNQNVQNIRQNFGQNSQNVTDNAGGYANQGGYVNQGGGMGGQGSYGGQGGQGGGGYGGNPPAGAPAPERNETEETTVISKNTIIDGNIRSLANMNIDGNVKGNVETTRNIEMSGKVIGDVTCNNAGMVAAAMQGNISLKGRMRMDRDTILIGDLSSQYADINGRIRGKLDIVGKAELKRDAVVFGDINASTIAVTDGAIIQGYVNTTFLSKEDSRNVFPDAISIDSKEVKS